MCLEGNGQEMGDFDFCWMPAVRLLQVTTTRWWGIEGISGCKGGKQLAEDLGGFTGKKRRISWKIQAKLNPLENGKMPQNLGCIKVRASVNVVVLRSHNQKPDC